MCTRIYHWHHLSLPNAIGTLKGRGRDGSNFLETAKMCGFSSAASLPAARCAGGSVFILFRKRCTGGKMENGGLWREASLRATLGVVVEHGRHCMQVVATLAPNGRAFSKTENRPQKWKRYHPHIVRPLARSVPTTYIFYIFQNLEEIDSCARESTTGTTSLL